MVSFRVERVIDLISAEEFSQVSWSRLIKWIRTLHITIAKDLSLLLLSALLFNLHSLPLLIISRFMFLIVDFFMFVEVLETVSRFQVSFFLFDLRLIFHLDIGGVVNISIRL